MPLHHTSHHQAVHPPRQLRSGCPAPPACTATPVPDCSSPHITAAGLPARQGPFYAIFYEAIP